MSGSEVYDRPLAVLVLHSLVDKEIKRHEDLLTRISELMVGEELATMAGYVDSRLVQLRAAAALVEELSR